MKKVVVTGAGGQLATCIQQELKLNNRNLEVVFLNSAQLDITNFNAVLEYFSNEDYQYCINCAAYTQVDKAEVEQEKAFLINEFGSKNLAKVCKETNTTLLHISTDFVFDGQKTSPYIETDIAKPVSVYGLSKLKGEQAIVSNLDHYFIFRTSWLYAAFGQNFMKSMLQHAKAKNSLSVVYDQVGTPTFANDLVHVLLKIISEDSTVYGMYHFSNEGVASWYDFAHAIFEINKVAVELKPILSAAYPLPATRPDFSVLDKEKIKKTFQIIIPHWRDSLVVASKSLHEINSVNIKNN